MNIYIQLRDNIESVISLVENFDAVPCDSDYYLKMRTLFNQKIQKHELDVECAALFIWINKHCFNGLYRVNSKGLFNVCFNKKTKVNSMNPDNLRTIGQYFRNSDITITHGDFEAACQNVKAGDFIYFDSPYVPISATACFTDYAKDGFTLDDHKRLAALCRQLDKNNIQFMCSNNDVPLVHELYDGFRIEKVDVRRSINCNASKRTGKEVIITNY